MQLRVPHGHQPNDYTCGPKSLWMILRYFGKRVPLAQLVDLCATTVKDGTTRSNMKRAMRTLGFSVEGKHHATLKDIQTWLDRAVPVVIHYREWENVGHYAVVTGMSKKFVVLHDPTYGPNMRISRKEFLERWYGKHQTQHTRWMMVAEPIVKSV